MVAAQAAPAAPVLEVRDLHKRYGGVRALRGVSFALARGQTYHLLGENGCGKSTLIKIVSGAEQPTSGTVLIDGVDRGALDPVTALAAGIETVYQDLSLVPNLSVEENIGLTRQLVAGGGRLFQRIDRRLMRATTRAALAAVDLPGDASFLTRPVEDLPIATRQLIAIARAIAGSAGLVIMDEPTTALTRREVENLIRIVGRLHADGVSVLFVTHKLDECLAIGGRALVMRDGQLVADCDLARARKSDLSELMTGRQIDEGRYRPAGAELGAELLRVQGLHRRGAFAPVDFTLARGEVLGITGLLDSGRNELALALAGVRPADGGAVWLDGRPLRLDSPRAAIAAGIGYVPEDRISEGLFLSKSIHDNVVMAVLDRLRNAFGLVRRAESRRIARQTVADLKVVAPDIDAPVQSLSGGNQQRVLIGRWLTIAPALLILHGPTVGVDVGSKDTIFRIVQDLAAKGMGVILISDDLPELIQNCDRVLVLHKGRIVAEPSGEDMTEEALYHAMGAGISRPGTVPA